jgi:outer membrane protein assembly factor BamB
MRVILLALALAAAGARADDALVLERTIPLPGVSGRIDHMAVDSAGARLFVAALGNGSVESIDLGASKPAGRIEGLSEPQGVGYVADPARLIVASAGDGSVRAYEPEGLKEIGRVRLGEDADNVRVRGSTVYVGYGDGAIAALDAGTLGTVYQVKLPATRSRSSSRPTAGACT